MPDLKDTSVCGEPRTDGHFCPTSPHPGDVHTLDDGTVFRTVPLIGDEALIAERLRLAFLDVEALNAELEPARYVLGPSGCADPEDRSCDEYDSSASKWCSHVEHRIATFADVKARGRLDDIVQSVRKRLAEEAPNAAYEWANELAGRIDDALEELRVELDDLGGKAAYSVSDIQAATAEFEAYQQEWLESGATKAAQVAAQRCFEAEEETKRLHVELRRVQGDKDWLIAHAGDALVTAFLNARPPRAAATPGGTEGSAVGPSVASEGPDVAAQHPEGGGDRG
jgi:hypothetical protein